MVESDNWRVKKLQELLRDDPNDEFVLYAIGQEYIKTGNFPEAIKTFSLLRSVNPRYVGLYYHLGKTYEKTGERKEAIGIYNEGIRIAEELGDQHSLSELQNARMNLEIEL